MDVFVKREDVKWRLGMNLRMLRMALVAIALLCLGAGTAEEPKTSFKTYQMQMPPEEVPASCQGQPAACSPSRMAQGLPRKRL